MPKQNFALIGAAGYIAPRHMKAIQDTDNILLAALDKSDSVGVIDSYFPTASFFTEFERFDRHIEKLKREGTSLHYLSVCSPNYLHDAHIRFGLRQAADVICEKPLVLNPWNLEALEAIEQETGKRTYTILQLRWHPSILELKKEVEKTNETYELDLTYITGRGKWYFASWKGDESKSGGIATNIGIHFFDMLQWVFGGVKHSVVHQHSHDRAAGFLELDRARIRWFLSINEDLIPAELKKKGQRTFRSIQLNGKDIEFSSGFTDLHTKSYDDILKGGGFGLSEAKSSIQLAYQIRNSKPIGLVEDYHPFAQKPLSTHPFFRSRIKE